MSREFHLVTRERPATGGFLSALRDATGDAAEPEVDGDFEDPNTYLNVSGPQLWIEIEPPGHVEAADLDGSCPSRTRRRRLPVAHHCQRPRWGTHRQRRGRLARVRGPCLSLRRHRDRAIRIRLPSRPGQRQGTAIR
jgi:hypothetical protein